MECKNIRKYTFSKEKKQSFVVGCWIKKKFEYVEIMITKNEGLKIYMSSGNTSSSVAVVGCCGTTVPFWIIVSCYIFDKYFLFIINIFMLLL